MKIAMLKNIFKNKFGQSMVEVMVAAGMIGGLAVGITTLMQSQTETQKGISAKFRGDLLYADIVSTLADSTSCLNTFTGLNPTNAASVPITQIKNASNAVKYQVGTSYQDRTVQLGSMSFGGTGNGGWQTDGAGTYAGYATLVININKIGNTTGGSSISRKMRVRVTLSNPTNLVTACTAASATGTSGGSLWSESGSTVYYNSGNVGVGLTNPSVPLTVAGTINAMTTGIRYPDNISQPSASGIWQLNFPGAIYYSHPTSGSYESKVGIGTVTPRTKLEVYHTGVVKLDTTYLMGGQDLYGGIGSNLYYNGAWVVPAAARGALLWMNSDTNYATMTFYTNLNSGSLNLVNVFNLVPGRWTTNVTIRAGASAAVVGNSVTCTWVETMTGGGCTANSGYPYAIQQCWPTNASTWACGASYDSGTWTCTPYAVCAGP